MARAKAVTSIAAVFSLAISSCGDDVELFTSTPPVLADDPEPMEPGAADPPQTPGATTPDASTPAPDGMTEPPRSTGPSESPDAGAPDTPPDTTPIPPAPALVVVQSPVAQLPLLGVAGGEARLGVCQGGVLVGVRTTANPSAEVFGQRITFVEPICGRVMHHPDAAGDSSGTFSVTQDDAMVSWSATDGFFGVPLRVEPDPRLSWVLQPETVCPAATPVAVGFSGEYDPIAPDVVDTAAIRSLLIECAPLALASDGADVIAAESGHQLVSHAESFAASGATTYRSACEGGSVATQIQVQAGFWLDGFALGCSRLRVE